MDTRWRFISLLLAIVLVGCVSNGGSGSKEQDKAVDSYMSLAKGYLQEGHAEKAVKPLVRALEISPRSAAAHGMLGLVYQRQGENKLAEQAFRKALSYDANAADVHNNYGAFLFSQDRLYDAYQQFAKAAHNVRYEHRSRAYENLGIVSQQQGYVDLARRHFEKALKLNALLPRARLELAAILASLGEYREAWAHYQVFTVQGQQNPRSLRLGQRLAQRNNNKEAAASYAAQLQRFYPQSHELKAKQSQRDHGY